MKVAGRGACKGGEGQGGRGQTLGCGECRRGSGYGAGAVQVAPCRLHVEGVFCTCSMA